MAKLIAMGELLIDFTGVGTGGLGAVTRFEKHPGGAPANVAVCAARLGAETEFVTKLGTDAFGDYLLGVLRENGVGVGHVLRTDRANTPLAFVSLDERGEREFAFYRNPSSDLFLEEAEIDASLFRAGDIFHFGSVDLADAPVRGAHRQALAYARERGALVSFDPNLRYALWKDRGALLRVVNEFLPFADLVKVGEDELTDIAADGDEAGALRKLFRGNVQAIIVTRGARGAEIVFRDGRRYAAAAEAVRQVDATGAGDTFVGTILYQLLRDGVRAQTLSDPAVRFDTYLQYANRAAGIAVTAYGAIPSMPSRQAVFGS